MVNSAGVLAQVGADLPVATLVKVLAGAAAAVIAFVFRRIIVAGLRALWSLAQSNIRHHNRLSSIRLVNFNRDRQDYQKRYWRGENRESICSYIASTKKEIVIVSISFVTGVQFEEIADTVRKMLDAGVRVYISLLNLHSTSLINSVSQTLSMAPSELRHQIAGSLRCLQDLRASLSSDARLRLHLSCHRTLPFASAIIIDPDEPEGTIQLETKPYKAGIANSFGFTLQAGGSHPLYSTLVSSYRRLIRDGQEIQ
jgi:hypothetical protein